MSITKTVGSASRNYTSLQLAFDSTPADFVADGNAYILECYADSEFVLTGAVLTTSARTTDSTHNLTIRAAAGQSWRDNASVQTNAFAYVAANGVAFRTSGTYLSAFTIGISNVVVDGLQISCTGSPSSPITINSTAAAVTIQNCIAMGKPAAGGAILAFSGAGSCTAINNLLIADTSTACTGVKLSNASIAVGNTIVRPSNRTAGGVAIAATYGTAIVRDCAIFGFASANTGTFNADGHNGTDFSSAPGTTGNVTGLVYANQFVNNSTAVSPDFKLVSSSGLVDVGVVDTTHIPTATDAANTSRPQGSAWDIGAWEYKSAGLIISGTVGGAIAAGQIARIDLGSTISALVGNSAAAGLTAFVSNTNDLIINGSVGNAAANGSTATIGFNITIAGIVGNAAANGSNASITNSTQFTTDALINNTGTVLVNQPVSWTWIPTGRIGSFSGLTPVDGTGTTNATTGRLTVTGLTAGSGVLLVAVRNTNALDDYVYYQAGTVA
jgi:hypothetical protein